MRARPHVLRNRETGEVKAHLSIKCDEAKFYSDEEFEVTCENVEGGFGVEIYHQFQKGKPPKVERTEVKRGSNPVISE